MVKNVIDCWVNVRSPDFVPPFSEKVFAALAKRFPTSVADESYKDAADLVSMMDSAGVTKAVLTDPYDSEPLRVEIERSMADFPDRFIGATAIIPSTAAVDKQRILEFKARGFSVIKVLGVFSDLPYDDPKFFPVYHVCEEEQLTVTANVGLPLVPISTQTQNPIQLDAVLEHFPDLNVVMCHGGLPYADTCVALMRKWLNLYWMSSAIPQKMMPDSIVEYGNTDGQDRLMLATDFIAYPFEEKIAEVQPGGLFSGEAAENYAWRNAERVFLNNS